MKWVLIIGAAVAIMLSVTACSAEPETPQALLIGSAEEGEGFIIVEPSSPHYETVKEMISPLEAGAGNLYTVSAEMHQDILDISGVMTEENIEIQRRWREQYDHWENVDAFTLAIDEIWADSSTSDNEGLYICSMASQWKSEMQAAIDYVGEFRRVDPETVAKNPGLGNLETAAIGMAGHIDGFIDTCHEYGVIVPGDILTPTLETVTPRVHTPTPDWSNMTEEEIGAELSKDPCFMGKGPVGWMWDTECQMNRP